MKILKYIIIIVIVLAGGWLVFCAVSPATLEIERSTSIEAPASVVFENVSCLDKWPAWSAWEAMDPTIVNEYSEDPCGPGAWTSWKGEKTGEGKQTIVEHTMNEYVKMMMVFGGQPGEHHAAFTLTEDNGATAIAWDFVGAESSFMFRPLNMMMKGVLVDAYDKGLANLKAVCESASPAISYEISDIELPGSKYLLISGDVLPGNIGEYYEENFGKMMAYVKGNNIEISGRPSGLFYSWSDTLTSMSAAIPIADDAEGTDEIEFRAVEGGRALQIDYFGPYNASEGAHLAMDRHMAANGLELSGAVREVYVTDPREEADTAKWHTQIIYPVKTIE